MSMKKIFALLCVCAGLTAMASAPASDGEMLGKRICLLHPYEWTESATGAVTVAPADPLNVGGWTTTIVSNGTAGTLTFEGGLAMHRVSQPFKVDYTTGTVTLQATDEPFGSMSGSKTTTTGAVTTTVDSTLYFYVVNEDWLVNYGPMRDVTGIIEADGSILIEEGFCYYIETVKRTTVTANGKTQVFDDTTTAFSPLYRNTHLVKPNGIHEYVSEADGLTHTSDVYIYQDEETVHVANLYGLGWPDNTMTLHEDGTMTFPGQAICDISNAQYPAGAGEWYNATPNGSSLTLGNQGNVTTTAITWGLTRPTDQSNTSWQGWNNNKLYYTDGTQFEIPGSVTVLRGDVNGDENVNIADVTALIDYLLSGNDTGVVVANADCNVDASVNIADVTSLIDYLLSGNWGN